MPSHRSIIKVFLASPGDLDEERKIAKAIVDEFNGNWADHLKYQVELVGWEDKCIVSLSKGRIRQLLNQYVSAYDWRYYNVIYWLDLGVSVQRARAGRCQNGTC